MSTPDVLIVGAGPAGAALGGLLAARGVQVQMVDSARFPRPKPCGECLNPGAVAALHRLGLWEVAEPLAPVGLRGWRMQVGRRSFDLDFAESHRAVTLDRRRLDHALAGWAVAQGAGLAEATRVTDLLWDERGRVAGVRVAEGGMAGHGAGAPRQALPARIVVGADGLRSVVVRRLGLLAVPAPGRGRGGRPPAAGKVAFAGHWTGVEGLTDRGELHVQGRAVCGVAPAGPDGEANLVLVLPADQAKGVDPAHLLRRWPDAALARRLARAGPDGRPAATGPFELPTRAVAAPGALLVGDAAGYFDPLTGQGIYRALRSAELAASAITAALAPGGDESAAFAAYQRQLRAEFAPAERRQRVIDALVRRPPALTAVLSLACRFPPAARRLMHLVGDCPCPSLKGAMLP